ncbi:hypothetical protein DRI50_00320 [candidate division KSB1 bacterium]|nr:MAG: hypothetical protein DRI50_00320 [candidate division KSB1 bacterium]
MAILALKILAVLFHASIFMIALPFKLLGVLVAALVLLLIALPLGLLSGLASIILIPLAFLGRLLPVLLIGSGFWALLRNI